MLTKELETLKEWPHSSKKEVVLSLVKIHEDLFENSPGGYIASGLMEAVVKIFQGPPASSLVQSLAVGLAHTASYKNEIAMNRFLKSGGHFFSNVHAQLSIMNVRKTILAYIQNCQLFM